MVSATTQLAFGGSLFASSGHKSSISSRIGSVRRVLRQRRPHDDCFVFRLTEGGAGDADRHVNGELQTGEVTVVVKAWAG